MEPMGHIAGMASAIIGAVSSAISLVLGTCIGLAYNNSLQPVTLGFYSCVRRFGWPCVMPIARINPALKVAGSIV